MKIDR